MRRFDLWLSNNVTKDSWRYRLNHHVVWAGNEQRGAGRG